MDRLCLSCGICCNGVLFKDVELQRDDGLERLKSLGLSVKNGVANKEPHPRAGLKRVTRRPKLVQPCAALCADCRCRVYADRPKHCRDFECALFKAVDAGRVSPKAALRTIRTTLERADQAKDLLRALGDTDEHAALHVRFRRLRRRFDTAVPTSEMAALYSDLTLAMHSLNELLRESFYA